MSDQSLKNLLVISYTEKRCVMFTVDLVMVANVDRGYFKMLNCLHMPLVVEKRRHWKELGSLDSTVVKYGCFEIRA